LFHTGAQLHRRFDRRFYFSTVGSSDAILKRGSYLSYPTTAFHSILTLTASSPPRPRSPPPRPRARRRPPLHLHRPNSRARRRRHPPRVWPPPRIPAKRRHLGSPALTGGARGLFLHPQQLVAIQSRCGEDLYVSPLHCTDLCLQCTISRTCLY
jgi:hypothetical protein